MSIVFICAYLLATDGEILAHELRGTEFLIAFCEHITDATIPELTIINDNDLPATVNISTPKAPSATPPLSITVTDTKTVILHQNVVQLLRTSFKSLAVWVTSDRPVAVQGFSHCGFYEPSVGAFQAIPVQELGTEHVMVTICQKCSCIIMIVGTEDKTNVTINFRIKKGGTVKFKNRKYKTGDVMKKTIDRYDTLELYSRRDLSGSYITSTKPVAVFSGSDCTSYGSKEGEEGIAEQIPHFGLLGTHYVIPFLPDLPNDYALKIISVKSNTVVRLLEKINNFNKFESKEFTLYPQGIYTLESNYPVMASIVVKSWSYYKLKAKLNVDVSLAVLYPVNRIESMLNLRRGFRIHGMFPKGYDDKKITKKTKRSNMKKWIGEVDIKDAWYMLVTDKNCNVSGTSVIKRDLSSHYAVFGFHFRRLNGIKYILERPEHCVVFSGIQWMRGLKQGGMMPWPITYMTSKKDNMEETVLCKTTTWVQYILEKKFKSLDFITDFIYRSQLICCR